MLHLKGLIIGSVLAIAVSILVSISASGFVSADGPHLDEALKSTEIVVLPELDDEVLVSFEHGDIHYSYALGSLWNSKEQSPVSESDDTEDK